MEKKKKRKKKKKIRTKTKAFLQKCEKAKNCPCTRKIEGETNLLLLLRSLIFMSLIMAASTVVMFVGCMVIARGALSSKAQPGFKMSQKTPHFRIYMP